MQLFAALLAATLYAAPADVEAAKLDYAAQLALGDDCRYLELGGQPDKALPVVQFAVVLASREPLIDHTVPERLAGTNLARIRLNHLRWSTSDWGAVTGHQSNPYTTYQNPLVVPAGYLVSRIADGTRSDAYLRLYFGGPGIPKSRGEFLAALGVDAGKQRGFAFGMVEGQSRVNLAGDAARLIRHDDGVHSEAWTTFDVRRVESGRDPLEALDEADFTFDGSEIFGLVPKVSTSGVRGLFPVMALANGAGALVSEAPVDLVEDHTRFAGQAAIRNPGSCIQCHTAGPQQPNVNALRQRLLDGVELLAKEKKRQVELELFHLGSVEPALQQWREGYAQALLAVNGLTPEANAAAFEAYMDAYTADLDLAAAALELHSTEQELRLAIGYAAANKINLGVRLSGLGEAGKSLPRSAFESEYLRVAEILSIRRSAEQ